MTTSIKQVLLTGGVSRAVSRGLEADLVAPTSPDAQAEYQEFLQHLQRSTRTGRGTRADESNEGNALQMIEAMLGRHRPGMEQPASAIIW